jgi:XTP/dITP diphosphohydrolase
MESGDRQLMVEELGDLLLQVAFHARVGQEDPDEPFDVDDVAAGIVDKLVRRHPHVFADVDASTPAEVEANWETNNAAETPSRSTPNAGIPGGMPPLARAAKVAGRLERAGRQDLLDQASADEGDLGAQLLRLVIRARAEGRDPSAALRAILRTLERQGRDAR